MKKKIGNIISWIILYAMGIFFIVSVYSVCNARIKGTEAYICGYRPVFILTGSMEPTLKTNGVAITKRVKTIDELEVNDIVTYHVNTDTGEQIKITHRVVDITEEGIITTKGDNNNVTDSYELSIDNVETKVVLIINQTAWIAAKWATTSGKILFIGIPICMILLIISLKYLFESETP